MLKIMDKKIFTIYAENIHLSKPMFILLTPDAYILVHHRLEFFMDANNMDTDQTAPLGAV